MVELELAFCGIINLSHDSRAGDSANNILSVDINSLVVGFVLFSF